MTIVRGLRLADPFLDPRLFGSLTFSSAALVSLLTGYAFATAIIGGAVFVDRVLYGGPDQQRFALGALAGATALGALVSGFAVRFLSLRIVTLIGPGLRAPARSSGWPAGRPQVDLGEVALVLGIFGFGFGLTVTPRSTAAVEIAGRASFGMASRDRHRRPDDRDGDRRCGADGLRLDDDRPAVRRALRRPRRLEAGHPGRAARPPPP